MKKEYHFDYKERLLAEEEEILFDGINNLPTIPPEISKMESFAFLVKDREQIVAGAKGLSMYGSLYVEFLWVSASLRGQRIGTKLIEECEKLGRKRGCTFITLMTMDWEALPFYQKLNFEIEFVRQGFEKNSKMYVLRKNL